MVVNKLNALIEQGLTITSIAEGCGVPRQTLSGWVNGKKTPTAANEERFNTWLLKFKETIAKI